MPTRLILFDIDGTLVDTAGAATRAMTRAAATVFGPAGEGLPRRVAGRTDAWMVERIAAHYGVPFDAAVLERFRDACVEHLRDELARPASERRVIPGAQEAVSFLAARPAVRLALLTGNFQRAARLKLEHFGLWHYFVGGAFGDDARDRSALLSVALARVGALDGTAFDPADVAIVGDTPFDVEVAVAGGARAVAVATGPYPPADLRAAGAHVVLPDLCDRGALIAALELDGDGAHAVPHAPFDRRP